MKYALITNVTFKHKTERVLITNVTMKYKHSVLFTICNNQKPKHNLPYCETFNNVVQIQCALITKVTNITKQKVRLSLR